MAPPIIAAAMLSRKLDSTKIMTSRTNAPFQSSGRNRGSSAGMRLSSKCFESSAKPSSSPSRLVRITHSCCRCGAKPWNPAPALKPVNTSVGHDGKKTGHRHGERVMMKQRHAGERQADEQHELDGNAEELGYGPQAS